MDTQRAHGLLEPLFDAKALIDLVYGFSARSVEKPYTLEHQGPLCRRLSAPTA